MSGKTTFIRIVGISAILGQTLNTCFARKLSLPRSRILSGIRISDNVSDERSYYADEVLTIKDMIAESRGNSACIFLLDELFKGTNTIERIAAGKAVLDYLNASPSLVFISTHDLELVDHLSDTFNSYHFTEVIVQDSILFDYKIKEGVLKTTNAIRLLELLDFPAEIISEARDLSSRLRFLRLKMSDEV
jgi:DNA mismatch repair ATPase MutS